MMMEFVKLKAFIALAKTGSFSRAAELLNTSQPVISIYIKQLEEEYGAKLIDRLGRRNVLTKDGEIFLKYANQIVKLEQELREVLSATRGEVKGTVIVGASNIPGMYIIPRLAGKFLNENRNARLNTVVGDSKEIISGVIEGDIEVGIVGMLSEERKLDHEAIVDDKLVLIAPPNFEKDKVSLEEIPELPYVQREQGSGTRKAVEAFLRKKFGKANLNVVMFLGSNEAVKEAVKSGVGVSFVSEMSIQEDLKAGKLKVIDVEGFEIKRKFYLIKRRKKSLSPIASTFYEFVIREMKGE